MRLLLEESKHFGLVRDYLRGAKFSERVLCDQLGLKGLNELLSNSRMDVTLEGEYSELGYLARLFLFGESLATRELGSVFPQPVLEAFGNLGLLSVDPAAADHVMAPVAMYPLGRLFIASDRWTMPDNTDPVLPDDFVFPAITANTSQFLATLPQTRCDSFLELCSGTGAAALAASPQAKCAWAVDITERSTEMAEFNRLLNGFQNVRAVRGDLYEGLGDLSFDRIVAHPPYMPVLNPAQVFYDGGVDGEQVTRRVVEGLPRFLRPGGFLYCLAQGSDRKGAPFEQRVRNWLGEGQSNFDVAIVVRRLQDPEETAMHYAVKSKGGSQAARQMRQALISRSIETMVYGWILIQRRETGGSGFTLRRSAGPRTGCAEIAWLFQWEAFAADPAAVQRLQEMHPRATPALELRIVHRMKNGELTPDEFALHSDDPFSVNCQVQPWVSFLIPQCDGKSTVREIHEFCKANNLIHPDTPPEEFARLLTVLISGGFLEVEGFELPGKVAP